MKIQCISAALLFLAFSAPALAAPREDAECLLGRLSLDDMAEIVAEIQTGGSATTAARLARPIEFCAAGQGWDGDRRGYAAGYAVGMLTRDILRGRLGAEGIDAAALDRWFARQTVAFRTTAFTSMAQTELAAALTTLVGAEVTAEAMQRNGTIVGGYLAALAIIERLERGLGM